MKTYNELDVLGFIESKLDGEECLTIETASFQTVRFDAYLPSGCRKLNLSANTFIEIKRSLQLSDIDTMVSNSRFAHRKICVILINDPDSREIFKSRYKYISFKSFQSWLQKDKTYRPGFYIYNKNHVSYHERIFEQAQESVRTNKSTLFVGAGLGSSLDLPNWKQLVSDFYVEKGIKVPEDDINKICDDSQLIKARFIIRDFDNSDMDIIRKVLYPEGFQSKQSGLLDAISHVINSNRDTVESVITYNYDDYIEQDLKRRGVPCKSIYKGIRAEGTFPVYHVHGFVSSPPFGPSSKSNEIVLTELQYHGVYNKLFSWVNIEQYHALSRNTCVFIGTSMTDPNLRRLLDAVFSESSDEDAFVIMSMQPDFSTLEKQYIFTSNMADIGVHVIWVNTFDDVPLKLKDLYGC